MSDYQKPSLYQPDKRMRIIWFPVSVISIVILSGMIHFAPTAAAPVPNVTETPSIVFPSATQGATAVSRYPDLIEALQKGNIETAIGIIQKIDKPQPEDVKLLSMGVRIMLDHLYVIDATDFNMPSVKAKMDAALLVADRAIQADPNVPDGWAAKALALNWAYRTDEAVANVSHARGLSAYSPSAMVVEAEIDTELHNYAEAQALLDSVFTFAQSDKPPSQSVVARAYYVRGNIEQILGHADQAIAAYEAAWTISSTPYNVNDPWMVVPPGYILYQLGPIYLFQGKGDLALKRYTEALAVDHQDAFLYYLRGRVYRFSGDLISATAEFEKCRVMDVLQWRCWRNLGQIAYQDSQWREAAQFFQPIVDDNSQISDDYYYLGSALIERKLCKQAAPYLRHGLDLVQTATGEPIWSASQFRLALSRC